MSTTLALTFITMGLAGLGAFLVLREFAPTHTHLDTAMGNLSPANLMAKPEEPARAPDRRDRVGAWAERHLGNLPGVTTPTADLDLLRSFSSQEPMPTLGESVREFYWQKILGAFVGLFLPTASVAALSLIGAGLPFAIPLVAGLALAVVFWFVPDRWVHTKAAEARLAFAQASVSYIRLVTINRVGQVGLITSMHEASLVSDGWMFRRIRQSLVRAQYTNQTAWDALEELAAQLDVPELVEIADITRLSGESGAGVIDSLIARSASMRDRLLTAEHTAAAKSSASLGVPVTALVALFMFAMIFPAAMSILGP